MAAEGITLRVDQDIAALESVLRHAADASPIMSAIAGFMVARAQRHIETETGPDGKWPPLSPRTARKKVRGRRRGTANMLRVTGRLYSSITGDSGPDFAEAGTNDIRAAIHQLGGEIAMPARRQDIHLSTGKGRRRFVKASARRKDTRTVQIGGHVIRIPARSFLYLTDSELAEALDIAADGLRGEATP